MTGSRDLSPIRPAQSGSPGLTQDEVAERLGIGQGDVSKLERRDDLLLSTLLRYLSAAGAEDARIVVTVHGQHVELDLTSLGTPTR
jgi:transcriptional regulator with XRE-family HTH domain